jgi:hypothetical protein
MCGRCEVVCELLCMCAVLMCAHKPRRKAAAPLGIQRRQFTQFDGVHMVCMRPGVAACMLCCLSVFCHFLLYDNIVTTA